MHTYLVYSIHFFKIGHNIVELYESLEIQSLVLLAKCARIREAEMNTTNENASVNKGTRKFVSTSTKRKKELACFSSSNIAPPNFTGVYSLTKSKSNSQKNINWHESEWPHLPTPALASHQCGQRFEENELLQAGGVSNLYEILSKESDENKVKTELLVTRKSSLTRDRLEDKHILQPCPVESVHAIQKSFTCTTREVEDITSSFTALKMSNKCNQVPAVKQLEDVLLPLNYHGRGHSQSQKKERKVKGAPVENNSSMKLNQETLLVNKQEEKSCTIVSSLCDDEFPDLLTRKSVKKVKKTYFPQIQDISPIKVTKRYPRRNDMISINLGEVLEHSSSTKNSKSLLRNKYCQGLWSGNTRADTSRRVMKRGKQREFPKRKTPTKLKLTILRDRRRRQQSRLLTNSSNHFSSHSFCMPNRFFSDQLETVQPGMPRKDLTSLRAECQAKSTKDETLVDFKSCAAPFSSKTLNPADIESHSDLLESDKSLLSSQEKEVYGSNEALNPFTERSLVYCTDQALQLARSLIHSRKYREYCNNDKCIVLEDKVKSFVTQIYRFQTKSHFRDADKARIHRRYVLGLREADKYFKLRKLKVLIIATDLEANPEKGGLDEIIENMKSRGSTENLPVIFALKRRDLAYCVYRKVPVSCVAVLNYEGAEELFRPMIDAWKEASSEYEKKLRVAVITSSKQATDSNEKISSSSDLTRVLL